MAALMRWAPSVAAGASPPGLSGAHLGSRLGHVRHRGPGPLGWPDVVQRTDTHRLGRDRAATPTMRGARRAAPLPRSLRSQAGASVRIEVKLGVTACPRSGVRASHDGLEIASRVMRRARRRA
jgi:hypothetical protein